MQPLKSPELSKSIPKNNMESGQINELRKSKYVGNNNLQDKYTVEREDDMA